MQADTGERLSFDVPARFREEHLNRLVHLATYAFALDFAQGRCVLDLGTGTGYGAAQVATVAQSVTGADVCAESISEARARFPANNLQFQVLSPDLPLPYPDASFDVVLSFQVIEHLREPHAHLREIRRVLRPGGRLLLATPNRSVRLFAYQRPWNRWHPLEYDAERLRALVASCFARVEVNMMSGDDHLIQPELRRYRRLRWLTLPVTLPVWPDAWRVWGLSAMRCLWELWPRVTARKAFAGDVDEIRIGADLSPALNLVVIAS